MESVYNKTFTPLNAGDLWKGRSEIVDLYNVAGVSCASDTNGLLSILQSQNDINYDFAELYTIVANTPFTINQGIKAKYFRVMFENTSMTNQTYLRLQTIYKNTVQDNLSVNVTNPSFAITGDIDNNNNISNQRMLYDLNTLNITMYADSINTAIVDPYGRDGWYWTNNVAGITAMSNLYWYSNTPGVFNQANITKGNLSFYNILNIDSVVNERCLPYATIYSKPTGVNDAVPGFYHSRWTYQINYTDNKLYSAESVMIVVGNNDRFADISPKTRRINLGLTAVNGEGLASEVVQFITLHTDASELTVINEQSYLIQYAGIYDLDGNNYNHFQFTNSLEKVTQINNGDVDGVQCVLKNVTTTGNSLNVNITGGGGGGGGGLVQIQAYNGLAFENLTSGMGVLNTFDNTVNTSLGSINDKLPSNLTTFGDNLLVDIGVTKTSGALDCNIVSGGTGGGLVQIQGFNEFTPGFEDIKSINNSLYVYDSNSYAINSKVFSATTVDTEAIKVFTVNSSSSTIQAVIPEFPSVGVPLSASLYVDTAIPANTHYQLETQSNLYGQDLLSTVNMPVAINPSMNGLICQSNMWGFNPTNSLYEPVAVSATGNQLVTQSRTHTANGQDIFGTVINSVRGLNIYNVGNGENIGSIGNIWNNLTLAAGASTTTFDINNLYLNESVFIYEDTSTTATGGINIDVSFDAVNFCNLATLFPIVSTATKRTVSCVLKLKAFKSIRCVNLGTGSVLNATISIFSS
jgi:hypothetical protein